MKLGPKHFYASIFVTMTVPAFAYFYLQYDREQTLANAKYKADTTKTSREAFNEITEKAKAEIEAQQHGHGSGAGVTDASASDSSPKVTVVALPTAAPAPEITSSKPITALTEAPSDSDLANTFLYVRTDKGLLRFQIFKKWATAAAGWNDLISHHDLTFLTANPSENCAATDGSKGCRSIAAVANDQLENLSTQPSLFLLAQPVNGTCESKDVKQLFFTSENPSDSGCRIGELTAIFPYKKASLKHKKFASRPAIYITSADEHAAND